MATATLVRSRVLVSRRLDGLLVGWLAVALWIVLRLADFAGAPIARLGSPLAWTALTLSAMHFGVAYHLAYADKNGVVRRRPFALLVAPAALAITLITIAGISLATDAESTRRLTALLLSSVYLLTMWHYIKQAYGVGRLGAAYAGISLQSREVWILRYALYPLWLMSVVNLLTRGHYYRLAGYQVGGQVLAPGYFSVMRILAFACAVPIVVVLFRIGRRSGTWPPALVVAPYVAAFLWVGLPMATVSFGLLLGAFHALQYLACAHKAEAVTVPDGSGGMSVRRWVEVFGGAACGGLLLTTWGPDTLNNALLSDGRLLVFSAAFFVFLNLHHYLVDGVIWRSNGDLVRAMVD